MRFDRTAAAFAACLVAGSWTMAHAETFEDDCSVSVIIKKPFRENETQLASGDIILAKGWQGGNMCGLVDGQPSTHAGVCQKSKGKDSEWTQWFAYDEVKNSETRRFRWVCGDTLERSRCEKGTRKVRFKLLKNSDEFRTHCSPNAL